MEKLGKNGRIEKEEWMSKAERSELRKAREATWRLLVNILFFSKQIISLDF